jgi:hypothetical protein
MSGEYPRSRVFFNILGGSLTLLSVQLPWMVYGASVIRLQSNGFLAIALYWSLAGAVLSFLSRYGGVMTFVGILGFLGEPYILTGSATAAIGVLAAFSGAIFTFAGVRWSLPKFLSKRREIAGGLLYTVGFLIVLTLIVGSGIPNGLVASGIGQLVVSAPLLLVGTMMTAIGLKLFLSQEKRENSLSVLTSTA